MNQTTFTPDPPPPRGLEAFQLLAETFQALGDPSRVQIVWLLSQGEVPVHVLAKSMNMTQPAVSHHLRTLRDLKLVRVRKEGRTSYYHLDDPHIHQLLEEGFRHIEDFLPRSAHHAPCAF